MKNGKKMCQDASAKRNGYTGPADAKKQTTVTEIEAWFISQISRCSGIDVEDIDIREPFVCLGLNSKQVVSMTGELGIWVGRSLPSTLGFDYPNIETIALYLAGEDVVQYSSDNKQVFPRAAACQQVQQVLTEQPSSQKEDRLDSIPVCSNFIEPEQLQKLSLGQNSEPIAIIGMGCRFPGRCNDPETFWRFLREGGDAITEVPPDRWDADSLYDSNPDAPGKTYTRWGGFLDNVDRFDAAFFGISPREAIGMDPQQRLVMEVSWEALENAGEAPDKLAGSRTGVFIGISGSDYGRLLFEDPVRLNLYSGTGSSTSIAANRVSYFLGLRGPSIAVDTACSSSLVSAHLACQSLHNRECNLALAGGVNLILSPEMTIIFSKARLMAHDGHCKTFDAAADGYVRSEGCGMVVLKRYSDAVRDGHNILALLLGTAVNQDGHSNGLTVPNGLAQQAVIREALANAGVQPSHVSYVETHGTGTSVGDPIEVQALGAVLSKGRSEDHSLIIGSVKTNIGHLEQAAGIAGLIKVVLCLQHEEIPLNLHFKKVNPLISLQDIPATIPVERTPWSFWKSQRIAGVSGFSFGGTNAHAILTEVPALPPTDNDIDRPLHITTLSARSENALKELARRCETFLETHPDALLADACFTANVGRSHFPYRLAVMAESTEQLHEWMSTFAAGSGPAGLVSGHVRKGSHPKVAFLFTGQGSQYLGMGQQLYYTQPTFRKALDLCAKILKSHLDRPLLSIIFAEKADSSLLDETAYTQPALFALEYALAEMWRSWGIEPSVVMGHSVGEYVAACVAGVFSLEDGLKLIAARGRLIQALPRKGEMAAVFAGEECVAVAVAPYANDVSIAAINGPENVVITGVRKTVRKVLDELASEGIRAVQLKVSHAFHSPLMEPMLTPFEEIAAKVEYSAPRIGLISNVTGQPVKNDEVCKAAYWRRHVRNTVRFLSGVKALREQGYELFVEIGPSPVLSGMGSKCLPEEAAVWLPSLRRGRGDWKQLLESLGKLYVRGVDVDWAGFDQDYSRCRVALPTYPFQRERYWIEVSDHEKSTPLHPLLGCRLYTPLKEILFESQFSADSNFFDEHRVHGFAVVSGSTFLEMTMAAFADYSGGGIFRVEDMVVQEGLYIPEDEVRTVQLILSPEASWGSSFQIFSTCQNGDEEQTTWTKHVTGKIHVEQTNSSLFAQDHVLPEEVKARCIEEVSAQEFYQGIWEGGLQLGRQFRWIDKIWRCDGEALAEMRFPAAGEEFERDRMHPGLIDSCTQLLFACLPFEKDSTYMFLGYDTYCFYGHAGGRLWCHIVLKTGDAEREAASGDYRLFNESGQVVAEAVGVHLKRAPLEALLRNIGKSHSDWLYEVEWKPETRIEIPEQVAEQIPQGQRSRWLIFADNEGVGTALAMLLEERGEACVQVFPGSAYEVSKEGYYTINPAQPEDFQRLIRKVSGSGELLCRVVHLWSLNTKAVEETTRDTLEADHALSCGSALYLLQEMVKTKSSPLLRLWLVTRGAQAVGTESVPLNVAQAPLWGLGKAIALEHAELFGGLVDFDTNSSENEVLGLLDEIWKPDGEDHLAFRQGQRYVARLLPCRGVETQSKPLRFQPNGAYMITGGLGDLGLEIARWMVEHGARHLVLVGRKGPSDIAMETLTDLEKAGAQIMIAEGDVSDQTRLAEILDKIHESMPSLRGIFHLAGLLDDGMLHQQDWKRFARVMAPKVAGAWNLHVLTKNTPLDFFVLFSSIASLVGSPGQGNYAAANAFMDTLAHHRQAQGQPALSINWGPWANSGMAAALGSIDKRRWTTGGVTLIAPSQGVEVLEQLFQQDLVQIGVIPVKWPQFIRHFLGGSKQPLLSELDRGARIQLVSEDDHSLTGQSKLFRRIEEASQNERTDLVIDHIRDHVVEVLWLDSSKPLDLQRPLMELGLDSLMVIELRNRLRANLRVDLPLTDFLHNPTIVQLAELVLGQLAESSSSEFPSTPLPQIAPAPDQRHLPFPLTDVQHAYWIGSRSGTFELGNVSCHVYIEVEMVGLDPERLNLAMSRLIERHDMLRAIVLPDGRQQILEQVPPYEIEMLDLRGQDSEVATSRLEAIRQRMSHQMLPADQWPLFEIRASMLDDQRSRLHISFDLLIGDGWSFMVLIRELYQLYLDPETSLSSLDLSFRDYVLAERNFQDSELYQHSLDYWRDRLATLPPAPDLPLAKNPGEVMQPQFVRRKAILKEETWHRLKTRAARAGLTPSGVLLAAFSEILAVWSKNPRFTIMLTLFNRLPLHPQVNDIVGDFTSLTLLAVDKSTQNVFEVHARGIQKQLWRDLEHRYVSGVQVLRELGRTQGGGSIVTIPVVFTSVLPYSGSAKDTSTLGMPADLPLDVIYCISQTPQVWLDHQVFEQDGKLILIWDAVEELFPEGLLDDMFDAYCRLIQRLADEEDAWQETTRGLLPTAQLEKQATVNATDAPISSEMLHTLFTNQVPRQPDHPAIISFSHTLSYEELSHRSNQVGLLLREKGAQPNTLVAVVMEKGWEQVVGVLGILQSGAAYLPIDPTVPRERVWHLLDDGKVSLVLTQSWLDEKLEWPDHVQCFSVDKMEPGDGETHPPDLAQKPEDLAYVIYTSGSTGLPKGVMIDHRGAVNTILDINRRFGVKPEDRVLALANLNFDLSVYDIFGTLAAGGTIVLPDATGTKDPAHWLELMTQKQVTIWNSVPALMQMLVEYASGKTEVVPQSLRLVLLSGDWIPLDLPEQIKALVEGVQAISLGGATEASIWSNLYSVEEVDPNWKSIPYGRPMVNQRFYVLNEFMEDCPDWVPGQLYIGGIGLAQGYWRDEEKTKGSFISHPRTGERLYRTGDVGRYLPDGNIEFLGREDFQVKIRGHRIELGEIETALKQHPALRDAVVTTVGDQKNKRLVGYLVPDQEQALNFHKAEGSRNDLLPGNSEQLHADGVVLHDPVERVEFKLGRPGVRKGETDGHYVEFAKPEMDEAWINKYSKRLSYRKFEKESIEQEQLGEFLRCLFAIEVPELPFPRYRYGSAGGLYPVQVCLYIKPDRVGGLSEGTYYYHPIAHRLVLISDGTCIDRSIFPGNDEIFDEATFAIFLIADLDAISPMYGVRSRDFCMIEAGLMAQLLETSSFAQQIGLCQIGALDFPKIRHMFGLKDSHEYLHCLLGGRVNQPEGWSFIHEASQMMLSAHSVKKSEFVPRVIEEVGIFLKQKLPGYMVPSVFMVLDELPLTPNGKVNRKALPKSDELPSEVPYIAPQNEVEQTIAAILQEVLDIEKVGINNNFFDLGANSLHLVWVRNKLEKKLKRDISIIDLFEHPTISILTRYITQEEEEKSFIQQADKRVEIRMAARKKREKARIITQKTSEQQGAHSYE